MSAAVLWDSNTWYSIQSFGSDHYLSTSPNSSAVIPASSSLANSAQWQVIQTPNSNNASTLYYIRPRAQGADNCLITVPTMSAESNESSIAIGPCSDESSSIWLTTYFNGNDASEGYAVSSLDMGTKYRLYIVPEEFAGFEIQDVDSTSQDDQVYMEWGFNAMSNIDDQAWSSVSTPLPISGQLPQPGPFRRYPLTVFGAATSAPSNASAPTSLTSLTFEASDATGSVTIYTISSITHQSPITATPNAGNSSTTVVMVTPTITASRSTGASATSSSAGVSMQSNSAASRYGGAQGISGTGRWMIMGGLFSLLGASIL